MAAAADYKVADITLADFGRKEIELAEAEMPGLMAARAEYGPPQTLKGASPYHTRSAFRALHASTFIFLQYNNRIPLCLTSHILLS